MNLKEMANAAQYRKMNRIFESRFGFKVDFKSMTLKKATGIINALSEGIEKIRKSSAFHSSEKNPQYMELLMVRESMTSWTNERRRLLKEGEVGQAEAILAARDIVDSIQKMIETLGKIQNEQMPALSDAIRDQIGSEQASSFRGQVSPMLISVAEQLMQAREGADTAVRQLTGEEAAQDTMDMGPEVGALPPEGGEMDMSTPPAAPAQDMGDEFSADRERR